MRLFVAVRPSDEAAEHLALAVAMVSGVPVEGLRWTVPENRHLTVAFYGEVPEGAVPDLVAVLEDEVAALEPFDLRLRGAGVFSGRTVWVGAAGDVDAMAGLARAATRAGEEVLGRHDARPRHKAHLTVARLSSAAGRGRGRRHRKGEDAAPTAGLVRALAGYEGPAWRVEEVVLVESHPGEGRSGGPRYDDVLRLPVGGRALSDRERDPGRSVPPH